MNKIRNILNIGFAVVTSALIASCGGGDGAAGDSVDFSVFPDDVNIKAASGDLTCSNIAGVRTTFTIVGGRSPFRIVNSYPQYLRVDRTEITGQDPNFVVTTLGGCGDNLTILVLDLHSRSTTVAVTVEPGDEVTPPAATTP